MIALLIALHGLLLAAPPAHPPSELIGTWKGTSTCTDLVAAPACHDEVVVYDFTAAKGGAVSWKADKVVNGERLTMGEFDVSYDAGHACWYAEFTGPRGTTAWCLVVEGSHLAGTGIHLPGKEKIRRIEVTRQP